MCFTVLNKLVYALRGQIGLMGNHQDGFSVWCELPFNQNIQPQNSPPTLSSAPLYAINSQPIIDEVIPKEKKIYQILLVEDDCISGKVAELLLQKLNCNVIKADTVKSGLEKLTTSLDLIMTDLALPDLSGIDFIKAVRQHKNDPVKSLPIVALSANVGVQVRNEIEKIDKNIHMMTKPLTKSELERILKRIG